MGELRSNVTVENTGDRVVFDRGHGLETDIRSTRVDGRVDTGGEPGTPAARRRTPRAGSARNGGGDLCRRAAGRTVAGGPRDRPDREPGNGHRLHRRTSVERAADRPSRARDARPDGRLREPHAGAPVSRLPGPESQSGEGRRT